MKPLAAIVRSSAGVQERQESETFHADEEQVAEIKRYVRDRPVIWMEPELDVSGGLPIKERPSLLRAIEGVERGEYEGVVAAYLSRLSRSRSGIEIWNRVEAAGGHVHAAKEGLDTSTPNGRFIRDIFLANAVREREEHVDRFASRREETVKAGVWRQHQLPRGYVFAGPPNGGGKFTGLARRLAIEPAGAEEVRQAARDVLNGVPVVKIAERLEMTPAGVRAMLRNRTNLGELRDGEFVNAEAHEAILDPGTFSAVAAALRSAPRASRREDGPALLAGLVVCAGCGHVMTRKRTAADGYSCAVHHSGGRCPAPASIACSRLDEYVENTALAALRRADLEAHGHGGDSVGPAQERVADLRARKDSLLWLVTEGAIERSDADAQLRSLGAELKRAEEQLEGARAASARPEVIPGDAAYQLLDGAGRNAVLRGLIRRVVVERSGRGGRPEVAERAGIVFAWDD